MSSKLEYEKNIFYYTIYFVFGWFHFVAPILVIYVLSFGLTMTQAVFALSTVFYVLSAILELPSGVFADLYGRKKSVLIGYSLTSISCALYFIIPSFTTFIIIGILGAIGTSFISGSSQALLYDTLLILKREDENKQIQGKALFYSQLLLAVTSISGAYLYTINKFYPFIAAFIFGLVALFALIKLKEPPYKKTTKNYLEHFKHSLKVSFSSRKIMWIIIYNSVFMGSVYVLHRSFHPVYIENLGYAIALFGIFFAVFRVISSLGSKSAQYFDKTFGEKKILLSSAFILSATFILMGLFSAKWVLGLFLILYFMQGMLRPFFNDYLNKKIESSERASVFSVANLSQTIFSGLGGLLLGYIATKYTIFDAYLNVGFIALGAFIFLIMFNGFRK